MSSQSLKYGHIIRIKSNDNRTLSYITSKSYPFKYLDTQILSYIFRPMGIKKMRANSMFPTIDNHCFKFCQRLHFRSMIK